MKQLLAILATVAVISSPAFAQKKKSTKSATPASSAPAAAVPSYSYSGGSSTSSDGPLFSADFGLGTISSQFALGLGFRAEWPTYIDGNEFRFGGQTGFYLATTSPAVGLIPILVTGSYKFHASGTLKPYVGLGMGIGIVTSGGGVDFAILAKPGFNFGAGEKYYFELPLGAFAGSFTIFPSIGMHF